MYLGILTILALSCIVGARPMKHYEGLAETYIQVLGSNIVANNTVATPHTPVTSSTGADMSDSTCKPFEMPAVPQECLQKSGELACIGYSLYCRFPTDWGVGYDPVGECWTCK
ncbi:uncharacterized protein GGS22DRAFT_190406 [Annulohypoxylon maeteangense]|uniref:uncharacterized protein n=1 Tax=Annulohypoxylon maeteangense TaxID=1927788 RepID=UPI0020074054|nr:uncharacterized protein GGS22DRAFT_190406 [Annulohypoxylon maeteangense]KAI0883099.1 hypothetical protein GGS22DRAFT_190406 [Annulohypoxylon maeteangense]